MSEKHDLEWQTFSDHLSSTTKRLMETKELADVTLVTDDQKQVLAHKIFLSAGSEIFRNILINNPHKHPFIYLTNINHQELEAIIQFLYLGTATLYQDRIDDFLSAAKNLQVKEIALGLDETSNEPRIDETSNEPIFDDLKTSLPPQSEVKVEEKQTGIVETSNELCLDGFKTSANPESKNIVQAVTEANDSNNESLKRFSCSDCSYSSNIHANLKKHYNCKHADIGTRITYPCPDCGKVFTDISGMRYHHKYKHQNYRDKCVECDYKCSSGSVLSYHIQTVHKGIIIRFYCDEGNCDSSFTSKTLLRYHKDNVHYGKTFPCSQCDYKSNSQHHLNEHINFKHLQGGYKCQHCDFREKNLHAFRRHVNGIHVGIKDKCSINNCNTKFSDQALFVEHVKNVHKQNPNPCSKCDFYAYNSNSLWRHSRKMH